MKVCQVATDWGGDSRFNSQRKKKGGKGKV